DGAVTHDCTYRHGPGVPLPTGGRILPMRSDTRLGDHAAGLDGHALREALSIPPPARARRPATRRIQPHHVRRMDRRLETHDPSLGIQRRRLAVTLADVDTLDHHPVLLTVHAQDGAFLPTLVPAEDDHPVSLPDLHSGHQITSGASETIFMNLFSRSSRPTGPKIRVARGSPESLMMTAAFSSNRMYDPSLRRISLRVRTTTAFATSPFF